MAYTGTYDRLGVHVGENARTVIRAALPKLNPRYRRGPHTRNARHAFLREILCAHRAAGELYRAVMSGQIG